MSLTEFKGKLPVRFVAGWYVKVGHNDYCTPHCHANWELVFHKHVRGRTCLGDGTSHAFEGQSIVLYAPGLQHDQIGRSSGMDHCIHIEISDQLAQQFLACTVSPVIHDNDLIANYLSLTRTRLSRSDTARQALDYQAGFVLMRFLQTIQVGPKEQQTSSEDYVAKAKQYILDNFRTIPSVKSVADHVGISYDYLRHIFLEHAGLTLNQYLINARIERGRQLLEHSTLNQSQIAQMTGLSNEQYFNTCFRKTYGMTPGKYRGQVR